MKKCFIALLAVIASLLGCDGPSGTEILGEIQLSSSSKDVIEIDSDGSTESVRFSSALDWHVECADTWLTINPMEGGPGTARISIKAGQNDTKETRQTVVTICSEGFELPITVTQEPFLATFDLLDVEKEVSCLGGEIVVSVYTDVDFTYECQDDWVKVPSTKAPRTRQVAFTVEPNTLPQERTTVITFVAGDITKEFTLTQRAAGTESDDWKKDQFVHRSLAMRFTATWCGYCPMLGSAFESAKSRMNGSLELVSLHGSDSNYEFSGTNTLISRFRVQGFPTGVVDARATINNDEQSVTSKAAVDVATETADSYPVTTGIACSSTLSGNTINVDLDLYVKEADIYRVTVLLLEDNITGYQNNGGRSDNNYVHNDVARLAITSMNGERIEVSEDYQVVKKSFSGTVRSSWDPDNMKVLIYVEKPYGDRDKVDGVDSRVVNYGNYGDTYIDNCRAVKVGETAALELR